MLSAVATDTMPTCVKLLRQLKSRRQFLQVTATPRTLGYVCEPDCEGVDATSAVVKLAKEIDVRSVAGQDTGQSW